MKKVVTLVVAVLLIFLMFFILKTVFLHPIVKTEAQQPEENHIVYLPPERNVYDIKAEYDGINKIKAVMNLTYVNNTEDIFKELYFHLYPNMFSSSARVPFFKEDFYRAFPKGFSPGGINIQQVEQDGKDVAWSLIADDEILKLILSHPVDPGNVSIINIQFELTIPQAKFRLGYQTFGDGKITLSLGN